MSLKLDFIKAKYAGSLLNYYLVTTTIRTIYGEDIQQPVSFTTEKFIEKLNLPPALASKPHILEFAFKTYLNHRHNESPILFEDLYKLGNDIAFFESLKTIRGTIPNNKRDLRNLTYAELIKILESFRKIQQEKLDEAMMRKMTPEQLAQINSETTILYDGVLGKVVMPHTIESGQFWGNGTKWCISARDLKDNMFETYNDRSPVLIFKNTDGKKYAYVRYEWYNDRDQECDFDELPKDIQSMFKELQLRSNNGYLNHDRKLGGGFRWQISAYHDAFQHDCGLDCSIRLEHQEFAKELLKAFDIYVLIRFRSGLTPNNPDILNIEVFEKLVHNLKQFWGNPDILFNPKQVLDDYLETVSDPIIDHFFKPKSSSSSSAASPSSPSMG